MNSPAYTTYTSQTVTGSLYTTLEHIHRSFDDFRLLVITSLNLQVAEEYPIFGQNLKIYNMLETKNFSL